MFESQIFAFLSKEPVTILSLQNSKIRSCQWWGGHLPKGIVKRHGVNNVGVFVESEQLFACVCVPDFAGAVVAASDELASILVESAVGEGQQVRSEHFEQGELLIHVLLLFLNQCLNEFFELGLARLRNQGLLQQNLVDQSIDVRPTN